MDLKPIIKVIWFLIKTNMIYNDFINVCLYDHEKYIKTIRAPKI